MTSFDHRREVNFLNRLAYLVRYYCVSDINAGDVSAILSKTNELLTASHNILEDKNKDIPEKDKGRLKADGTRTYFDEADRKDVPDKRVYLPVQFSPDQITLANGRSWQRGCQNFRLFFINNVNSIGTTANHFRGSHIIIAAAVGNKPKPWQNFPENTSSTFIDCSPQDVGCAMHDIGFEISMSHSYSSLFYAVTDTYAQHILSWYKAQYAISRGLHTPFGQPDGDSNYFSLTSAARQGTAAEFTENEIARTISIWNDFVQWLYDMSPNESNVQFVLPTTAKIRAASDVGHRKRFLKTFKDYHDNPQSLCGGILNFVEKNNPRKQHINKKAVSEIMTLRNGVYMLLLLGDDPGNEQKRRGAAASIRRSGQDDKWRRSKYSIERFEDAVLTLDSDIGGSIDCCRFVVSR